MHSSNDNINILVKKIINFELKELCDLKIVINLSKFVYDEWLNMKDKYRYKIIRKKILNKSLYAKYEAEEELIIGLLFLLNEKIINFTISNHK